MDDVIKLVAQSYESDKYKNQLPVNATRQVFCRVRSVGRSDFYAAAQVGLHPSYVFVLSNYRDYMGEREILYTDWTGVEKRFVVVRTYRTPDDDSIEITVEEKVGRNARSNN